VSSSLIVIAPLFIAAVNYLLIGRIILAVLPSGHETVFRLRPTSITKIFISIDIFSFLIQASGSGIAASGNWEGNTKDIGVNVLLGGLGLQLLTIVTFLFIVASVIRRSHGEGLIKRNAPEGWQKVLRAVLISAVLILVSPDTDSQNTPD
jgi:hypothetical protein